MRLQLNIRNQLLLTVMLIIIGLGVQFLISSASDSNLTYIQDQKENYLARDVVVSSSINDFVLKTNEIISVQLGDYLSGILQNSSDPLLQPLDDYQTRFTELLSLLLARDNSQYGLDFENVLDIPVIYEVSRDRIDGINNLVDSQNGAYQHLKMIQSQIENVVNSLQTSAGNLKIRYIAASNHYFSNYTKYQANVAILNEQLFNFEQDILSVNNITYVQKFLPELFNLETKFNTLSSLLANTSQNLQISDATVLGYLNIAAGFDTKLNETLGSLLATFEDMKGLSLNNASLITNLANMQQTFYSSLFFPSSNLVAAVYEFSEVRSEIGRYQDSTFVKTFGSTQTTIIGVQDIFTQEHQNFLNQYNLLEKEQINRSQSLVLVITLFIGLIVLALAVPTIWRVTRSTGRLQKNFKLASEGDLSFKLRKPKGEDEFDVIENSFNSLVTNLREVLGIVQQSGGQLAGISEELAAGTEEASASLNEVSRTVGNISSGAIQQNLLLDRLRDKMNVLRKEIKRVTSQIEQASSNVVNLSQRTNILGLNASISAAKAGKFARGFGIVAEEIRDLANSSKNSSNQIAVLVEEITTSLRQLSNEMSDNINQVKNVAESTAEGSELTSTSANEQVIMLSEISETSNDLAELANNMDRILSRFKVQ